MSTLAIRLGVAAAIIAGGPQTWAATHTHPSAWRPVLSASGQLESGPQLVDAAIIEEVAPPTETPQLVGNSSTQRDDRARRLRLLVRHPKKHATKLHEVAFPSVSVPGDPCSVRRPEKIEVKHGRVVLSVHYEFACGSGSGGGATFVLGWRDRGFELERLSSYSASREGGVETVFDYRRKLLRVQRDKPENVRPTRPLVRRLAAAAPRWPNISFEQCPRPRERAALPEC